MTRQWLADPNLMCQKHIVAEHFEAHMFLSKMEKGYSLKGFIEGSMFFGASFIQERHDLLAQYIEGHKTPLYIPETVIGKYPEIPRLTNDFESSLGTLYSRCKNCFAMLGQAVYTDASSKPG